MKPKIILLIILLFILGINLFYPTKDQPNQLTQNKIDFFKINGASHFIGRLNLWYFFASRNDWLNASKFESDLDQIQIFKANNQPEKLSQKISELQKKNNKDAQDYLKLAKIQSLVGQNDQAVESIKQAHQLDPIRSDLDKLFYSVIQ